MYKWKPNLNFHIYGWSTGCMWMRQIQKWVNQGCNSNNTQEGWIQRAYEGMGSKDALSCPSCSYLLVDIWSVKILLPRSQWWQQPQRYLKIGSREEEREYSFLFCIVPLSCSWNKDSFLFGAAENFGRRDCLKKKEKCKCYHLKSKEYTHQS